MFAEKYLNKYALKRDEVTVSIHLRLRIYVCTYNVLLTSSWSEFCAVSFKNTSIARAYEYTAHINKFDRITTSSLNLSQKRNGVSEEVN